MSKCQGPQVLNLKTFPPMRRSSLHGGPQRCEVHSRIVLKPKTRSSRSPHIQRTNYGASRLWSPGLGCRDPRSTAISPKAFSRANAGSVCVVSGGLRPRGEVGLEVVHFRAKH